MTHVFNRWKLIHSFFKVCNYMRGLFSATYVEVIVGTSLKKWLINSRSFVFISILITTFSFFWQFHTLVHQQYLQENSHVIQLQQFIRLCIELQILQTCNVN